MTYVVFNIDTTSLPNYSRLLTAMVGREGDTLCVLVSSCPVCQLSFVLLPLFESD